MPANLNAVTIQAECEPIAAVWKKNPEFAMKDVTLESFLNDLTRFGTVEKEIAVRDLEATPLRNEREALARKLQEVCVRARSGMKGFFGPNSDQYEQAGGTRAIARKKPGRKPAVAPTK